MNSNDRIIRNAFASLVTAGALAFAANGIAADNDHSKEEKCAGVVKATKNDCATSMNQCHGHVTSGPQPGGLDLRAQGPVREDRRSPSDQCERPDPRRQELSWVR